MPKTNGLRIAECRSRIKLTGGNLAEQSAVCTLPSAIPPEPSLRRNFSWTLLGDGIYAACQWGMFVVMAKLGTPEMVGQLALGLALATPVIVFASLQLRGLQATDASPDGEFSLYFTLRLVNSGLALLAILSIALLSSYPLETKAIIGLVGLFKSVEAISDIFHGQLQRTANMKWVCVSLLLKGPLTLVVLGLGLVWTPSLTLPCLGITLLWLLLLLAVDARYVTRSAGSRGRLSPFSLSRDLRSLQRLLYIAFPLGVVAMLIALNYSIPRLILEWYEGDRELGVYSAQFSLVQASSLVAAALGVAASGKLGLLFATGDANGFLRLLTKLSGLSFLVGITGLLVVLAAGPELMTIFYSAEYANSQAGLCWLMVAAAGFSVSQVLNWGVLAARRTRIQLPFYFSLVLITATACMLLVPSLGLAGAALGVTVMSACQVLGNILILRGAVRSLTAAALSGQAGA